MSNPRKNLVSIFTATYFSLHAKTLFLMCHTVNITYRLESVN